MRGLMLNPCPISTMCLVFVVTLGGGHFRRTILWVRDSTCLAGPVVKDERLDGGLVVDLDLGRHRRDDLVHLRDRVPQAPGDARPRDATLVVAQPGNKTRRSLKNL